VSKDRDDVVAVLTALAERLAGQLDETTVKRVLTGELTVALAERNPVAAAIDGLEIEDAYVVLNGRTPTALKKYFSPGAAVAPQTAPAMSKKVDLVAAILQDAFNRTYEPPKPEKPARKAATPRLAPFDAVSIASALERTGSVDEARDLLKKLGRSKANHQALADQLRVEYTANDTLAQLQAAILRQAVTRRLEHDGYLRRTQPASYSP
jgi:hypothetical protein